MAQPLIRVSEQIGPFVTPVPSFEAHANPLRTLVREAAQNSWDARNPEAGAPPLFRIDTNILGETEATYLHELLGDDDVPGLPEFDAIAAGTPIIVVHDTFTCGLDGDLTRAADVGGRWWRFVGNYGDRAVADAAGGPADSAGGGSFGLGKLAYFGAALSRLVVIHSHVRGEGGEIEARFIVYGIGNTITLENYTGRHWWGRSGESMGQEIPLPVVGEAADAHAASLGLPYFEAEVTGTSFCMIDAETPPAPERHGGTSTRGAFIRECVLWNLWPKQFDDESKMEIQLFEDGREIELIDAADDDVAKHFVRAYAAALQDDASVGTKRTSVSYRTRKTLSIGAAIDAHAVPSDEHRAGLIEAAGGPSLPLRHVMLMRDPRLVVVYHPVIDEAAADDHPIAAVAVPPNGANVSISDMGNRMVDRVLRRSEPEAHDRWDPERARLLPGEKAFVRDLIRKINSAVGALHTEPAVARDGTPNIGLGRRLAEHFIATGRLYPPSATTTKPSNKQPSAKLAGTTAFDRAGGRVVSEHAVDVNFASYSAVELACSLKILTEGGGGSGDAADDLSAAPSAVWVLGDDEYPYDTIITLEVNRDAPLRLRIERASWHQVAATFKTDPVLMPATEEPR